MQTTTSIAESERSDKQENHKSSSSGNGKPSSSQGSGKNQNGKESKGINGREEKIQNAVFETTELEKDAVEHLGEVPVYRTMDIQTDESSSKSEKKS